MKKIAAVYRNIWVITNETSQVFLLINQAVVHSFGEFAIKSNPTSFHHFDLNTHSRMHFGRKATPNKKNLVIKKREKHPMFFM